MSQKLLEYNFDGLIGPSHHYGGLASGNLKSKASKGSSSNPKLCALQGLEKIKTLAQLQVPQGILPLHPRPNIELLYSLGFRGTDQEILSKAYKFKPGLLSVAYSSAHMWVANCATGSPSIACADNRVHITPANLLSGLHRSTEHKFNAHVLRQIFSAREHFVVHEPLASTILSRDEGSANYNFFYNEKNGKFCELFVYGAKEHDAVTDLDFIPRQTELASQLVAQQHGTLNSAIFAQQNLKAINLGAFHNDLVSVGHANVFFYHLDAFVETEAVISELTQKLGQSFYPIQVSHDELSLEQALACFIFNSQIVSSTEKMYLIAPSECAQDKAAQALIKKIIAADNPISDVLYIECQQSLQNGGGPACLRFRLNLTEAEAAKVKQTCLYSEEIINKLWALVENKYRDNLELSDLQDIKFYEECMNIQDESMRVLELENLPVR